MNFCQSEIKKADDIPIRSLKLSDYSDHLIAIQDDQN